MQLKVVLPEGEVNVPVEPNSTPGHLKENLKYSIRLPPKLIRLTCDGRELNDIKPFAGEPNNVTDGATILCEAKEGVPEDEGPKAEAKPAAEKPPVMIKKEEPPKPKKPKRDVVRPTVGEGDVVKTRTVTEGRGAWTPEFVEGRHPKRHLAFLRIEAGAAGAEVVEVSADMRVRIQGLKAKPELNGQEGRTVTFDDSKGRWQTRLASGKILEVKPDNLEPLEGTGRKVYPEQDGAVVIAMGDPQVSPAWTAAVMQLEVGERAEFTMSRKVVDYDPEGLAPSDSVSTWVVELLRMEEALDIAEDFMQLLHVEHAGTAERLEELDAAGVHWRVRRWQPEGCVCIASSRERIAIMPGYGLVPIEDIHAPPTVMSVGEGQQEAVETIAMRLGPGGAGHLYLKTEALKENRPGGCVIMDVELVSLHPQRGPGSPGWKGWTSLLGEREKGDRWLAEADERRKQLESFGMLQKSTSQSKGAEAQVAAEVHKFANNASRRYRRALRWLEAEGHEDHKTKLEKSTLQMSLAKASTLAYQRFGEDAGEASEEEKRAVQEAKELLAEALPNCEALEDESRTYACLRMILQVTIQGEDVSEARTVLDRLTTMRPDDVDLKSDAARINRLEAALTLKSGASAIEDVQKDLQAAVAGQDAAKVSECLKTVEDMITGGQVTWDTVRTLKVGKDVGNAMKMGNPDIATQARKVVAEIQALASRNAIGL